jgi:hypothetical protein
LAVFVLEFKSESTEEADLVIILLDDGDIAVAALSGQWLFRYLAVREFDIELVRRIGQVVDLCEKVKTLRESFFAGEIQLGVCFLPDILIQIGLYLFYPVPGVREGDLEVQAYLLIFIEGGDIADMVGLSLQGPGLGDGILMDAAAYIMVEQFGCGDFGMGIGIVGRYAEVAKIFGHDSFQAIVGS